MAELMDRYKTTELGMLPEDWEIKNLGDISKIRGGYGFSPDYQGNVNEKIPFFKVSDMNSFGNEIEMDTSNNYVSEEVVTKIGAKTFPKNTIIFPKRGGAIFTNKKRILITDSLIDNNLMGVTLYSDEFCLPKFLFHYFLTLDLKEITNSGPLPAINDERVKNIKIPLPPLPEQHAIATTLRTVQEAKEKNDAVIAATKALKAAMMKHLFTYGPVPPVDAERVALKDTEIGCYPQLWREGRFDEFIILQRGFDITKDEQRDGIVPVVSSSGIKSYHNEFRAKGPGVIIGRKGTLGKVFFVDCDYWPHDTSLWVKDFKGNSPKFVYFLLTTLNLKTLDTGTSNPTLNRNYVHALKIAMPNIEDQKIIVDILSSIDQKLAAEQSLKEALDTLFASLLHDLMTAKIRVGFEGTPATKTSV